MPSRVARPLFVATILVGSFLLFLVQPMVARMALPRLGGAPNVWNSAMLVYQALLLAGYAYAHLISKLPFHRQVKLHLLVLALGGLMLPISLFPLPPSAAGWEVLWVPLLLVLTVGPVFFVVSSQASLMQRWFAAHPDAGAPWGLYAASNLGSFAGLAAYPLLAEPLLSLDRQSFVWGVGYGLLIVLVAIVAATRWRVAEARLPEVVGEAPAGASLGWRRICLWVALSAIPSGLMLSTTTHLTTDIFAMPLLWVIPLGLYLLSFVIAFADNRLAAHAVTAIAPITLVFAGGFAMVSNQSSGMALAFASVALLFVISVSLHSRLYDLRPDPSRLTLFYLVMSAGGALGGAFTAILAPVLFDWVWEHPLLIFAAALVMPLPTIFHWHRMPGVEPGRIRLTAGILLGAALFFGWGLLAVSEEADGALYRLLLTVLLSGIALLLIPWRALFVAVLALLMLVQGGITTIATTLEGNRQRSYFGVYAIRDYASNQVRMLVHGTTLHGQQFLDPARARETLTYYGPGSGVAIALEQAPELYGPAARIGVVGLGTGTLACLRRPGQDWTFFEIDRAVLDLSRDGTFTFLEKCAPDARVRLGDARLELEDMPARSFDVLVVDAFTSDAIPLHLLTDEAMGVYQRALSRDGLLVIHISNRFIDLEPVLSALAARRGLVSRLRDDNPADHVLFSPSSWVVLSRDAEMLQALVDRRPDAAWSNLKPPARHIWTDDYASILPYLRWHQLLGGL